MTVGYSARASRDAPRIAVCVPRAFAVNRKAVGARADANAFRCLRAASLFAAFALCWGCGSNEKNAGVDASGNGGSGGGVVAGGCHPGDTTACDCGNGLTSVQECQADGTLGACECEPSPWDDAGGPPHIAGPNELGDSTITAKALVLAAQDLVRDPTRETVYVTVSNTDADHPNELVALSAATGDVEWSVFVGSEPRTLAISSDGSKIYVALNGSPRVIRVDVATHQVDLDFGIGEQSGRFYPGDLAVSVGSPQTVVVDRMTDQRLEYQNDAAVFDDGVMRAEPLDYLVRTPALVSGDEAGLFYAYDNLSTAYSMSTLRLTATGIVAELTTPNVLDAFDVDLVYEGGRLFATNGDVVDAATHARLGTFGVEGPVVSDSATGKVFIAEATPTNELSPVKIDVFDRAQFTRTSEVPITGLVAKPLKMVRGASDGFVLVVDEQPPYLDPQRWVVFARGVGNF